MVAGEIITLVAMEPAAGDGITYQWEIIDRAGSTSALSATAGASVTIAAQGAAPFAFLVEMRAYDNEALTGRVRREFGARTPDKGLRLPLFSETADPAARLSARNIPASTDNAVYADRASSGVSEQNWRGWTEFLHEMTLALEAAGSGGGGGVGTTISIGIGGTVIDLDIPDLKSVRVVMAQASEDTVIESILPPSHVGDPLPSDWHSIIFVNFSSYPLTLRTSSDGSYGSQLSIFGGGDYVLAPFEGVLLGYMHFVAAWTVNPLAHGGGGGGSGFGGNTAVSYLDISGSGDVFPSPALELCTHFAIESWEAGSYITGLPVPAGTPWDTGTTIPVLATNVGDSPVELRHNVSAGMANLLTTSGLTVTLAPGQSVVLIYNHDQSFDIGAPGTGSPGDGGWWVFPMSAGGGGGAGDIIGPGTATAGALAAFSDGTHIVQSGLGVTSGNLTIGSGKTVDGRDVSVDGTKLDGIEAGAQVTSLARINTATGRVAATDGAKLDGIESGAQVTSAARVLTALAAAAGDVSVNTHKITNLVDPTNPQDAATRAYVLASIASGWRTYCDFNFTQLPNQTLVDGNVTVDGVPMVCGNIASGASAAAIINGTGLRFTANSLSTYWFHSGHLAAYLAVDLPVHIPGWQIGNSQVRISAECYLTTGTANYATASWGLSKHPFVLSNDWVHMQRQVFAGSLTRGIHQLHIATEYYKDIANTYKLGQIVMKNLYSVSHYIRTWAGADTDSNDLAFSDPTLFELTSVSDQNAVGAIPSIYTPPVTNSDHFLAFVCGQNGNTLNNTICTFKRLRVEYKL